MYDYPPKRKNLAARLKNTDYQMRQERRKPQLPDVWVYVGTYVGPGDPGNDPGTTWSSPPWQNSFASIIGKEIAFRNGLDGQTDMIGMYDLTQGAVSGTVAFKMPQRWALNAPEVAHFPVELSTDVWTIAVQTIDHTAGATYGDVKIFWPIVADPVP